VSAAPHPPLLLTVDRGNTTLDCCLWGGSLERRQRLDPETPGIEAFVAGRLPDLAGGLSVVPDGLGPVADGLRRLGVELLVAGVDLPCPLDLAYPEPATLGVDRWVAALAARRLFGTAVVVDCGTAVTVDLVTAEGRFLGGAIAPGLAALARGLAAGAPALPVWDRRPPAVLPPVDSADAVRAGVTLGFAALCDGLVERLRAAAGRPDAVAVVTGGDAEALLEHARSRFRHVPDLVHEGLRCLLSARLSSS
jgi:type III pantothenate kinase